MKFLGSLMFSLSIVLLVHGQESKPRGSKPHLNNNRSIQWTKPGELSKALSVKGKAFRDIALESVFLRLLQKYSAQDRLTALLNFKDPLIIGEGFEINEENQLMNINFSAKDIVISGLSLIDIDYLRVVRHFGLNDLKLMLTLSSDIVIKGNYKLTGTALAGLLPVSGEGPFHIRIQGCKISSVILMATTKEMNLILQDIQIGIGYKKQELNFENLMGGGVMRRTAQSLMNTMGKMAFQNNMQKLKEYLKKGYRDMINIIF